MKITNPYHNQVIRISFIIDRFTGRLSRSFVTQFFQSTLPMAEKMELLRHIPRNQTELVSAIEVLRANFDTSKVLRRDQEVAILFQWANKESNPVIKLKWNQIEQYLEPAA